VHEAETITDCDERGAGPQLWLLRFLRVVEVTLATDTLNFADPIGLRSVAAWTLLEVHLRILAQVDHGTKVISMTLNDSNISINLTGPRISEYLVGIWTTTMEIFADVDAKDIVLARKRHQCLVVLDLHQGGKKSLAVSCFDI